MRRFTSGVLSFCYFPRSPSTQASSSFLTAREKNGEKIRVHSCSTMACPCFYRSCGWSIAVGKPRGVDSLSLVSDTEAASPCFSHFFRAWLKCERNGLSFCPDSPHHQLSEYPRDSSLPLPDPAAGTQRHQEKGWPLGRHDAAMTHQSF